MATEHAIIVEFPFPGAATTEPLRTPAFTLHPTVKATNIHCDQYTPPHTSRPLNLQRWPASSPATASPNLPSQAPAPPPAFLGEAAKALFLRGIEYLRSQECFPDPTLNAAAWLAAYGAHTIPNFSQTHCAALADPLVLDRFRSEVVTPLVDRHDTSAVFQFLHSVLSAQQITTN